jgi:hypothetical protein
VSSSGIRLIDGLDKRNYLLHSIRFANGAKVPNRRQSFVPQNIAVIDFLRQGCPCFTSWERGSLGGIFYHRAQKNGAAPLRATPRQSALAAIGSREHLFTKEQNGANLDLRSVCVNNQNETGAIPENEFGEQLPTA